MSERTLELLKDLPLIGPVGYHPSWDDIGVGRHYDRDGESISMRTWCRLRIPSERGEFGYVRVAADTVGPYWISTVWLGLDHGYGEGPPLIFESMVFKGEKDDLDCRRYATEEEAKAGHQELVEEVRLLAALDG